MTAQIYVQIFVVSVGVWREWKSKYVRQSHCHFSKNWPVSHLVISSQHARQTGLVLKGNTC